MIRIAIVGTGAMAKQHAVGGGAAQCGSSKSIGAACANFFGAAPVRLPEPHYLKLVFVKETQQNFI